MINLFKTNNPAVYLYLLFAAFLLKGSFYFLPGFEAVTVTNSIWGNLIFSWLRDSGIGLGWIHSFNILLVFGQSVAFNTILTRFRLISQQNFLPSFLFILLTAIFPEINLFNPAVLAHVFLFPFLYNMLKIPETEISVESFFFTAFFVALASFIYFPVSFLLIVILFALLVLKSPHWRELAIIVLGYIIPYLFSALYFFISGNWAVFEALLFGAFPEELELVPNRFDELLIGTIILVLVLIGYFRSLGSIQQNILLFRKYTNVFAAYLLTGMVMMIFVRGDEMVFVYSLVAPISFYFTYLLEVKKVRFWHNLVIYLLIAIAALNQWNYIMNLVGN